MVGVRLVFVRQSGFAAIGRRPVMKGAPCAASASSRREAGLPPRRTSEPLNRWQYTIPSSVYYPWIDASRGGKALLFKEKAISFLPCHMRVLVLLSQRRANFF